MIVDLRWEDEREREVVEKLMLDWHLYGQMHLTNANGITRLDPTGITYAPTGTEVVALPRKPSRHPSRHRE